MSHGSAPDIRAAGGVVWRIRNRRLEIALVHRPRYDDWSLPKGKLHEGESELAAAIREVEEELGSRVAVSRFISSITYDVGSARKRSSYWVMRHVSGEFVVNDEVDAVEWLPPKSAIERITHPLERAVMNDFASVPIPESTVVLVRHAKAGKRSEWHGDDQLRPLDRTGRAQADNLVTFLPRFAPDRVVSAEPVRCQQTVQPFADKFDLEVGIDAAFGDTTFGTSPTTTETALWALAKPRSVTVVASQGDTIAGLVDRAALGIRPAATRKSAAWVLSVVDNTVVSADYYQDAGR